MIYCQVQPQPVVELATLLWVIGIFVTILSLLVAAIYYSLIKNQDRIEVKQGLTDKKIDKNADDGEAEHQRLWTEINALKKDNNTVGSDHKILCQKHEDEMKAIREHITNANSALRMEFATMQSKFEGQGAFLNQRIEELKQTCKTRRA
jgi:hypothetical protein